MRSIFLHMNDFLLGISFFKNQKPDILYSSLDLVEEIRPHRHIVSSYILGSILSIELCIDPSEFCLDAERACYRYSRVIREDQTIDVARESPREYQEKISRQNKTSTREIDSERSWIFSVLSCDFFESLRL